MTQSINSLLVDIGGTNTRVAQAHGAILDPTSIQRFRNSEYPNLNAVLETYLADNPNRQTTAICVDIAGPVTNGIGTLTNLDWTISAPALQTDFGFETADVINDMQAQGFGLNSLPPAHLVQLAEGTPQAGGTQLVINVGTGLNSGAVYHLPTGPFSPPSETGHVDLVCPTPTLTDLYDKMKSNLGFVSAEDALSGRGFANIHQAISDNELRSTSQLILADLDNPTTQTAITLFSEILGRTASNLALSFLPFGGIYLVGGMARVIGPHLLDHGFIPAFLDKGRFSDFVSQFPIYVVDDDDTALHGCAAHIARLRNAN